MGGYCFKGKYDAFSQILVGEVVVGYCPGIQSSPYTDWIYLPVVVR